MNSEAITVKARIEAPALGVWMLWTTKEHIKQWHFASSEWHTPKVKIELVEEGVFRYQMAAKDESASFAFEGKFEEIDEPNHLSMTLTDGRKVMIKFKSDGRFTNVTETFEPEAETPIDDQRRGWQAILNNFKDYAEDQLADDDDDLMDNSRRLSRVDDYDD